MGTSFLLKGDQPGEQRDSEMAIRHLMDVLDRNDVVEAVDRLEDATGLHLNGPQEIVKASPMKVANDAD